MDNGVHESIALATRPPERFKNVMVKIVNFKKSYKLLISQVKILLINFLLNLFKNVLKNLLINLQRMRHTIFQS